MKIEDAPFENGITNDDMSQAIDLCRKYLLSKAQHTVRGKTNIDESEAIIKKRSPPRGLVPPMRSKNLSHRASLLEQKLLPGIGLDGMQSSSTDEKPSKGQLTIFYAGTINVYDNVSIDKAQAIMLLAGEGALSKPVSDEVVPETEARTPLYPTNLDSAACKLQARNLADADLPMARKLSLQHFIQKRCQRIINRSSYASSGKDHKDENETKSDQNQSIT